MTNEIVLIHCLFPWNIFYFQGWRTTHVIASPCSATPDPRKVYQLWWLIEYEYEQIKEISYSPGINGGVPRSHPWSPHRLRNEERSHARDDDRACGSIFRLHGNDDVSYSGSVRAWWRQFWRGHSWLCWRRLWRPRICGGPQ